MKVLNVYRNYYPDPPGGLQEAIRQVCLSTHKEGVKNTIFTLSKNPTPKILHRPEGTVVRERSWIEPASCDIGGFNAFKTFSALHQETDLTHYFFPWPFLDLLHAHSRQNRPTVLTYVSDVVRQRLLGSAYKPLMWKTLKSMDVIVANCPAYVETSPILSDPRIRSKVRVIPLGIDEHTYPKIGDSTIFLDNNLNEDEPYFLFIGVFRYYKGLHTLIQAANGINAKIVIAGSGPEAQNIYKLCQELHVTNVVFTGQVSDAQKVALLQGCYALILPSHLRSEAFGMVLVEAAMMGKPMISCEIGTGTSYVNIHGQTGLVIPPEDSAELHRAMKLLLADEGLQQQMGQGARARYELLFSGPALGKAYSQLYKEMLK